MTTEPQLAHDARCTIWNSDDATFCDCRDEQGKRPREPWNQGPWVAFDTETTGIDVTSDRIVTATVIVHTPGSEQQVISWLADPGVDIPDGAAAVHGISTEHARQSGRPAADVVAEIAQTLIRHWATTTPLIGFNVGFDLSILAAELRRHHNRAFTVIGPVVDPLVIDRAVDKYRKGSRKLVDVCRHYGITLSEEDAHAADADALAAARVAWKIANRYPDKVGELSLAALHEQQVAWHRAWADHLGEYLTSKGKSDDVERDWPMRGSA